ncbi:unnamed protein product [Acanthosepion pharaonis]|uniref:VWFC domain-containing protein n=1 Tax=Acanthosepion pharaonis TaxID=158019 RepID=A0A812DU01_ACAPH|nr:unnamed protein product [Sepia pharaonis]
MLNPFNCHPLLPTPFHFSISFFSSLCLIHSTVILSFLLLFILYFFLFFFMLNPFICHPLFPTPFHFSFFSFLSLCLIHSSVILSFPTLFHFSISFFSSLCLIHSTVILSFLLLFISLFLSFSSLCLIHSSSSPSLTPPSLSPPLHFFYLLVFHFLYSFLFFPYPTVLLFLFQLLCTHEAQSTLSTDTALALVKPELLREGVCTFQKVTYSNGAKWYTNVILLGEPTCGTCMCKNGKTKCKWTKCPRLKCKSIVRNKNSCCFRCLRRRNRSRKNGRKRL